MARMPAGAQTDSRDTVVAHGRDALVTLAVALFARLPVAAWASGRFPPAEDGHYYDVLARRLAAGDGYTWLWPDGAVTYAAHYPVGYPAVLAAFYAVLGASTFVAMAANAVVGAVGACAAALLAAASGATRKGALAAGLLVALHPAIVPYTAALMTEGVTASLLLMAAAAAARARAAPVPWRWWGTCGIALGVATLVRPQSLLLAPAFGALAVRAECGWRRRGLAAVATTLIALACVAPWTARNCVHMRRCALVSVNGGWNLLIGLTSETGAWHPVAVPDECATVWDEAAKDVCFERAAERRIAQAPLAWLGQAPRKLAQTFDSFGGAPWYLHASSPADFDEQAKARLGAFEAVVCRALLVAALGACARLAGPRWPLRVAILGLGVVAAFTVHGWPAYLAIPASLLVAGPKALSRAPAALPLAAAVIAATALLHAVFFGAGRYGLVAAPFVAVLAALVKGAATQPAEGTPASDTAAVASPRGPVQH
jgi:hypothetical protein